MDMEFILGRMEGNMKALMKMIRNMVLAFIHGRMKGSMKAIGRMENSMEVDSLRNRIRKKKVYGIKGKDLNGLKIALMKIIVRSKNDI